MLVLTRKVDDRIQIGKNITITVLRIRGRSVQIGIEAPDSVEVLRGELAAAAELRKWVGAPKRRLAKTHPAPSQNSAKDGNNPLTRTDGPRTTHRCPANQ